MSGKAKRWCSRCVSRAACTAVIAATTACTEPASSTVASSSNTTASSPASASGTTPEASPTIVAPPPPEAVESPRTPEQFVGKHVLVAAGTSLRVAAKPDATALVLEAPDGRLGARAFAVVGHEAGMLKLERAKPEARCDDGLPELDEVAPALFVEPERVVPVLAREAVVRSPDGTSVRLRPGVAVEQTGPNGIVDAGGIRLELALDPLDVGTAFTPAMAPVPGEAPHRIHDDVGLRYGGKVVTSDQAWFGDGRGVFVLSKRTEGEDAMVEVVNACVTVQARVDPTTVDAQDPDGLDRRRSAARAAAMSAGMLGMLGMVSYRVGADVPLSWADGTPAGKLAREALFPEGRHRKAGRTLACFGYAADSDRIAPFELCVKTKHAKREDPFGAFGPGAMSMSMLGSSGLGSFDSSALAMLDDAAASSAGVGSLGSLGLGEGGGGGMGTIGDLGGGGGGGALSSLAGKADPTTRVTFVGVTTTGGLAAKAVRSELEGLAAGIRYCAESTSPTTTGKLSVAINVRSDGAIGSVEASGADAIEDCVSRTFEGLSLPSASDATSVRFTLKISRGDP